MYREARKTCKKKKFQHQIFVSKGVPYSTLKYSRFPPRDPVYNTNLSLHEMQII